MIDSYNAGIPSLPMEIQEVILKSLTFQQRLESSMTCKTWRSMILNWSGMWRNLSTDDGHTIVPDLVPYKPYIASHFVKRVHIVDYYNGDPWHAVEDFLLNELKCDAIQDSMLSTITQIL
ncbi:hypothetical protein BDC45DRAFT_9541 [Circinella umbellata]|nr:hypothetical protein BDC45DRAFT_9541 [Circinella umbellata]